MLLKKLMEDKQLDFNQPLLSVRRFSSTGASSEAEVKKKTNKSLPKIPPLPAYKSELKSGPIRNPGTVPFLWEQTPGRPKDESKSQTRSIERPPIAPKLPPGRISNIPQQAMDKRSEGTNSKWYHKGNDASSSQSVSTSDKNTNKCENSVEEMEETEFSSTEGGDKAYLDALDTLSRTESFFFNCSISGVSALDDIEVKPSGTFTTDPQTRDFMIDRFLPAAKAMASEVPHHANRKQTIAQEQSRNINKIVNMDKPDPPKQHNPNNLPFHAEDKKFEESDDEDDYRHPEASATVCGLLPRFCLKNSFCLLNPVPEMRLQARQSIGLVHRAPARDAGSCIPEKAKNSKVKESDQQRKGNYNFREILSIESTECESDLASPVEKTLYIDSVHKVKYPNSNSSLSDTKNLSDFQGDGFDALRKSGETEATHPIGTSLQGIKLLNVTSEKVIPRPKSLESIYCNVLSSPEKSTLGLQIDTKSSSREDQGLSNNSIELASPKMDGSGKIDLEGQLHKKLSDRQSSHGLILNYSSSPSSKMAADRKADLKHQTQMELSSQEGSPCSYAQLPLSLPPPKSPSDSWLKRTLPTVSVQNSSSRSALTAYNNTIRVQTSKTQHVDPKWETIVKTSNEQNGYLRFSEERLTTVPES